MRPAVAVLALAVLAGPAQAQLDWYGWTLTTPPNLEQSVTRGNPPGITGGWAQPVQPGYTRIAPDPSTPLRGGGIAAPRDAPGAKPSTATEPQRQPSDAELLDLGGYRPDLSPSMSGQPQGGQGGVSAPAMLNGQPVQQQMNYAPRDVMAKEALALNGYGSIPPPVVGCAARATAAGARDASAIGMATPLGELRNNLTAQLNDYQALKAGWVRTDFWWDLVKPSTNGGYDWSALDEVVDAANARGMSVIGELQGLPSWVRDSGGPGGNVEAFGDFARAAAAHFGKRVSHWEIWNEQNLSGFWGGQPNAAAYTQLLKAAYTGIKTANPQAVVITGGLSPAPGSGDGVTGAVEFLQQVYANGGKGYFDAVGFHPYSWPLMPNDPAPYNGFQIMKDGIRGTMVANGDGAKQVWMTEYGSPTGGGGKAVSEAQQAEMLRQALDFQKNTPWAGPLLYYSYKDRGNDGGDTEAWFGLRRPDGSAKPTYAVFQNACAQYAGG